MALTYPLLYVFCNEDEDADDDDDDDDDDST